MSSDADVAAEIADIIDSFDGLYRQGYCELAASALFLYDTVITFDREVACFWTAKRMGASRLLYFANKWLSIAVYVMLLSQFSYFSSDVVHYGYQFGGFYFPPFGCLGSDNLPSSSNIKRAFWVAIVFISRVPLIVADMLLIYITWTKLSSKDALRGIGQSKRLSLSDILFRSGTIYFVVLFILNLLHLVLSATSRAGNGYESYVTEFTAPFTAILVSRFLLGLQEANQMVVRLDPDDPLHSSRNPYDTTPSFISSLGGFVNPELSAAAATTTRSDDDEFEFELQAGSRAETGEEEPGSLGAHGSQTAASSSSA
ncbi:hypothetical protein K466DRAFT_600885 [Polyporus arcularius HHB13444]|uniref:DUF6533 domain-containing protein n=1 Tax=Polyporus arcularius HHB13444 TaxID=1314778 RepID=A0A5C3PIK5_9APHY|nr:hypothetical protein K466DRAFT_600885 [Polyporus arcularius HHB13444]